MKDTIYFQHDFNSKDDPKMVKIRMKFWLEWYWLFWTILEHMRWDTNIVLKDCDCNAFAFQMQYDFTKLVEFLLFCVDVWLFLYDKKDKVYYSERLQTNVERMRLKSKKAKDSADERRKKRERENANALPTQSEGNAIQDSKGQTGKEKEEEKKSPPPLQKKASLKKIISEMSEGEIHAEYNTIINEFVNHWSETDKKGNEKRTKEKTWDLNLRLARWKNMKDTNFGRNKIIDYTNLQNFHDMMMKDKIPELKQVLWVDWYFKIKALWKKDPLYLQF